MGREKERDREGERERGRERKCWGTEGNAKDKTARNGIMK